MRRITILLMSIFMLLAGAIGVSAESSTEDLDYSVWNPEDFTYEYMEQRLYGCDYSRDFTIKGEAVKGFSETGLLKLEKNKDLVLPRRDTEGNILVGVYENAFKGCGLTSVKFPSGMMVPYDDTLTNVITKRGNYVIASAAFSGNELTEVTLPSGVIAVMPSAFLNNKIESVTLPRTIWWIENQAFAKNRISKVNFPTTCDFQLEMHGLTFANNRIKSVRLPDYTTVVNKTVFAFNPGKEEISSSCPDKQKLYTDIDGNDCTAGVVYMYTDNAALADCDRIHHDAKPTESQYSYYQKLVVNDGTEGTQNTDIKWVRSDFIIEGTVIKGLSESGTAKRTETTSLILPDRNAEGKYITEIASAKPAGTGLFATAEEQFKYVELPSHLKIIGDYAFQNSGVEECLMPSGLTSIGTCAFQTNNLESVVLPDTVTELGNGAFATNKELKMISLSKGLTEIPDSAFGCSDKYHYMTGLTEIDIPEGITRIGQRAFAGNNFREIVIPSSVKEIGEYAFSTKNYLRGSCEVELNDGLEVIGDYAFRNKVIRSILIPESVKSIGENTFLKEYSDGTEGVVTTVILTSRAQYEDAVNFPVNESNHRYVFLDSNEWNPVHFDFEEISETETAITGLSQEGEFLLKKNSNLVIPSEDFNGRKIVSVSDNAFEGAAFTSVELPEGLKSIGRNAFSSCKLTSLALPASVSEIGASAFEGNLLERVDFAGEAGKLAIGERAFARNSLVYAVLPERELTVAGDVFAENKASMGLVYMFTTGLADGSSVACTANDDSDCQKLVIGKAPVTDADWNCDDFTWDEENSAVTGWSDYGMVKRCYSFDMVIPGETPAGKNVTAIADGAFCIPDSEVEITKFGIESPTGLKSVVIPDSVKTIGEKAFRQNALTGIDLKSVDTIGAGAFYGNSLESVSIPDSVTEMRDGCFATNQITSLKLSKNLTVIPMGCFSMNIRLERVEIPEGVREIQQTAFAGARLTELHIPSTVERIGRKAFHLHHLEELTIPGNVKVIEESAFEGTYKETTLKSLVLEEGVEEIGKYAFKEGLLQEVDLPNSLKVLGDEPFLNNEGINGTRIVKLNTHNQDHLSFAKGDSYRIEYVSDTTVALIEEINRLNKTLCELRAKLFVPNLDAGVNSYNSIKLSWKSTDIADGYVLRRYDGSKWADIPLTDGQTSYTDTGLTVGKTYKYRLMPYMTYTRYGEEDEIRVWTANKDVSIRTYLPKPSQIALKSSKRRLTVSWNKVAGASGYQIVVSTKKTSSKVTRTIPSAKYTSGKLSKKRYYVKVRAYRNVNGKRIYSAWSVRKSIKVR